MNRPPTARALQKARARHRLLEAALELARMRTCDEVQIADITAAAGVVQGTFYVHCASREAMFDLLLRRFNERFAERGAQSWRAHGPELEAYIHVLADVLLEFWQQESVFVRACAQRMAPGSDVKMFREGINPEIQAVLHRVAADVIGNRLPGEWPLLLHGLLAMWLRVGLQCLDDDHPRRSRPATRPARMTIGAVEAFLAAASPVLS